MVSANMISRVYHHVGHDNYLEVDYKEGGWLHSRIMHSKDYNRPSGFTPVYKDVYIFREEDLPDVIKTAQSGDHGLWGSDEDY
tara:strand:+ start:502 stop:750 length:249 start_codon:yes stop_codon:yes gene_type:complete